MAFQIVSINLVSKKARPSPGRREEKVKGDLKRVAKFLNIIEDDFH